MDAANDGVCAGGIAQRGRAMGAGIAVAAHRASGTNSRPGSDGDYSYDPNDYHDNTDRWVGEIEPTPVDPMSADTEYAVWDDIQEEYAA